MGMCLEKQNALCHEYAGLKDKLEKFGGYDPKQLHHAYRIRHMMEALADRFWEGSDSDTTYRDILYFEDGPDRDNLIDIKVHGVGDKESAEWHMQRVVVLCRNYYSFFWDDKQPKFPIKNDTLKKMEEVIYREVKDHLM